MIIWHRDSNMTDGVWRCYFSFSWANSNLEISEKMMSKHAKDDVLWRANEDVARRMVWC